VMIYKQPIAGSIPGGRGSCRCKWYSGNFIAINDEVGFLLKVYTCVMFLPANLILLFYLIRESQRGVQ